MNWASQQGFLTFFSHSNLIFQLDLSLAETWSTIVTWTIQWALTTIPLRFWGHHLKYQQRNPIMWDYVHRLLMRLTTVTPPAHHNFSLLPESQPTVVTYLRFETTYHPLFIDIWPTIHLWCGCWWRCFPGKHSPAEVPLSFAAAAHLDLEFSSLWEELKLEHRGSWSCSELSAFWKTYFPEKIIIIGCSVVDEGFLNVLLRWA